jgi:hypothetical protein
MQMPDDEQKETEEDDIEKRFREIEERTAQIRRSAAVPDPPKIEPRQPKEEAKHPSTAQDRQKAGTRSSTPPHVQRGLGIALAIGYSFVGPLLAGILLGTLADGKPGGKWTLVGILVGTIMAFVLLIRLVNKLNQDG